jgi:hypothetical protein
MVQEVMSASSLAGTNRVLIEIFAMVLAVAAPARVSPSVATRPAV